MSKFVADNHIIGKVYDLTQENMCAMLDEIDALRKAVKRWEDEESHEAMSCYVSNEKLDALREERDKYKDEYFNLCKFADRFQDERDRYRQALEKIMPIVEEAFWDHHTAGTLPGSGYNQRVYQKVSEIFGWQNSEVFTDWKESLGLEALKENA